MVTIAILMSVVAIFQNEKYTVFFADLNLIEYYFPGKLIANLS